MAANFALPVIVSGTPSQKATPERMKQSALVASIVSIPGRIDLRTAMFSSQPSNTTAPTSTGKALANRSKILSRIVFIVPDCRGKLAIGSGGPNSFADGAMPEGRPRALS
jgi:hypothetical protein